MLIETIGWIGALLFSLCAVPQAIACYRDGNAKGLDWLFLLMWAGGEVLTLGYVLTKDNVAPLIVNYVLNLACLLVILYYKIKPRPTILKQVEYSIGNSGRSKPLPLKQKGK